VSEPDGSLADPSTPEARVARLLGDRDSSLAVAESVTAGGICARLARCDGASAWLRGGLVAYRREIKYELLGVEAGPVVSDDAARTMAAGVAVLLGADFGLSTTGVAGPECRHGEPVGTLWVGWSSPAGSDAWRLSLDGEPDEIRERAADLALERAVEELR